MLCLLYNIVALVLVAGNAYAEPVKPCDDDMHKIRAEYGNPPLAHEFDYQNIITVVWIYPNRYQITFEWGPWAENCRRTIDSLAYQIPEGSYLNEPDGFRGISWGTNIRALKGMILFNTTPGGIKFFSRKGDAKTLGSVELGGVYYGFWKGRLSVAMMTFKGLHEAISLRMALFEKFGEGASCERIDANFCWQGDKTSIIFAFDDVNKKGHITMVSSVISKEMADFENRKRNADTKAAIEQGF